MPNSYFVTAKAANGLDTVAHAPDAVAAAVTAALAVAAGDHDSTPELEAIEALVPNTASVILAYDKTLLDTTDGRNSLAKILQQWVRELPNVGGFAGSQAE